MTARAPVMNEAGGDSPNSEEIETRFSTPVSELDDHRNQTSTRPRGDTLTTSHGPRNPQSPVEHGSHGGQSPQQNLNPELLWVKEGLRDLGTMSRYSEQAIVDDDTSAHVDYCGERRGSKDPSTIRRGTIRKSRNLNRSRDSSPSSRTSSPANSVDAFADSRRRERANTVESRPPSEHELGIQRTISGGTYHRRPTITSGSVRDLKLADDRASVRAAEEDVCFPTVDEPSQTSKIDFEELEEFVAEQNKIKAGSDRHNRCQRLSFSSHGKHLTNGHFSPQQIPQVPQIVTESATPLKPSSLCGGDESDNVLDEKLQAKTDAVTGVLDATKRQNSFTEPVRYSFFSTEIEQTIHAAGFEGLLTLGENVRDLFALPEDNGVWWLNIQNPTEEEMEVLQKAFGIHRLTTEDIMTQEAREKVELFKQYYFVCFRSFFQVDESHEDYMEPVNVYMVVFREGVISITYEQSPHAGNVRKRIGKLRDFMALTADWICYAMIDDIVDTFGPPIHNIEVEADTIEDQVFVARTDDFASLLRQIGHSRKKVMSLMRLLGGKADVIKGFAKRCNEQYSVTPRGEIGLYLGDIQDHVVTMMSNLGHFEKMLSRSHSNYLAQLSIDHIAQGSRANEVLSKITLLASILVPLNLICGLFGMNVNVPGKQADGLGWFFGILGVIFLFSAFCLLMARKLRYI